MRFATFLALGLLRSAVWAYNDIYGYERALQEDNPLADACPLSVAAFHYNLDLKIEADVDCIDFFAVNSLLGKEIDAALHTFRGMFTSETTICDDSTMEPFDPFSSESTNIAFGTSSLKTAHGKDTSNTVSVVSTNTSNTSSGTNTSKTSSGTNTSKALSGTNTSKAQSGTNTSKTALGTNTSRTVSGTNTSRTVSGTNTSNSVTIGNSTEPESDIEDVSILSTIEETKSPTSRPPTKLPTKNSYNRYAWYKRKHTAYPARTRRPTRHPTKRWRNTYEEDEDEEVFEAVPEDSCSRSKTFILFKEDFENGNTNGWMNSKLAKSEHFTSFMGQFKHGDVEPVKTYLVPKDADELLLTFDFYEFYGDIQRRKLVKEFKPHDGVFSIALNGHNIFVGIFDKDNDQGRLSGSAGGISWSTASFMGGPYKTSMGESGKKHQYVLNVPNKIYNQNGLLNVQFITRFNLEDSFASAGFDNFAISATYNCKKLRGRALGGRFKGLQLTSTKKVANEKHRRLGFYRFHYTGTGTCTFCAIDNQDQRRLFATPDTTVSDYELNEQGDTASMKVGSLIVVLTDSDTKEIEGHTTLTGLFKSLETGAKLFNKLPPRAKEAIMKSIQKKLSEIPPGTAKQISKNISEFLTALALRETIDNCGPQEIEPVISFQLMPLSEAGSC